MPILLVWPQTTYMSHVSPEWWPWSNLPHNGVLLTSRAAWIQIRLWLSSGCLVQIFSQLSHQPGCKFCWVSEDEKMSFQWCLLFFSNSYRWRHLNRIILNVFKSQLSKSSQYHQNGVCRLILQSWWHNFHGFFWHHWSTKSLHQIM